MKFDELNQLKRFFSTMEISDDEKKKRCDLAYLLYDAIYFTFSLIKVEKEVEELNFVKDDLTAAQYKGTLEKRIEEAFKQENIPYEREYVKRLVNNILDKPLTYDVRNIKNPEQAKVVEEVLKSIKAENFNADGFKETLTNRITDALEKKEVPYKPDYIPQLVNDIIAVTNRHPDDPYYLSKERALLIAQNESNSVHNFADYEQAKRDGKTYKTWITENDERVRLEHAEVDGMKIPINEKFAVGSDLMDFPHDYLNGTPGNLINCRCVCLYE